MSRFNFFLFLPCTSREVVKYIKKLTNSEDFPKNTTAKNEVYIFDVTKSVCYFIKYTGLGWAEEGVWKIQRRSTRRAPLL